MKRSWYTLAACCLLATYPSGARADGQLIRFGTMFGVDGPFLGNANPVRELDGGGLPWVVDQAEGRLSADGKLEVLVTGLIIPDSIGFGFNPAPFFRVAVSCLSVDGDGLVSVVNVLTDNGAEVMIGDPEDGNARFNTSVDLPTPCVAPIVFVTSPGGAWFAATGR
ncbi:MAG TPA: hypothetical protein VE175_13570 [Woeseiaceae bacterium]|jgi:hypothetical protein|nr:hypothetical protein [Woeseiaceae bacterium]